MLTRYVSLAILLLLLAALGFTFIRIIIPFLLPLFLAAVVALIANPVYKYFLTRTKNRPRVAAGLSTAALVAAIVIPIFIGVTIGALQMFDVAERILSDDSVKKAIAAVKEGEIYETIAIQLENFFPINTSDGQQLTEEEIAQLRTKMLQERAEELRLSTQNAIKRVAITTISPGTAFTTVDIIGKFGWTLMSLLTFIIALYYFFFEGPVLIEHAIELIPVNALHQKTLFEEFGKAIRAVVTATLLAAVAQGLATSVALWFLGFNHFFLFTIVGTFAAIIPLAGTWLVWVPCAIYLAYDGDWGWALLLTIYGFAFVGMLDNFIRAYVLHSDAKLHPLLAFVSVLGGLQVMGLWGVFIAPVIACCLYAIIRIFNEELTELTRHQKENNKSNVKIPAGSKPTPS